MALFALGNAAWAAEPPLFIDGMKDREAWWTEVRRKHGFSMRYVEEFPSLIEQQATRERKPGPIGSRTEWNVVANGDGFRIEQKVIKVALKDEGEKDDVVAFREAFGCQDADRTKIWHFDSLSGVLRIGLRGVYPPVTRTFPWIPEYSDSFAGSKGWMTFVRGRHLNSMAGAWDDFFDLPAARPSDAKEPSKIPKLSELPAEVFLRYVIPANRGTGTDPTEGEPMRVMIEVVQDAKSVTCTTRLLGNEKYPAYALLKMEDWRFIENPEGQRISVPYRMKLEQYAPSPIADASEKPVPVLSLAIETSIQELKIGGIDEEAMSVPIDQARTIQDVSSGMPLPRP